MKKLGMILGIVAIVALFSPAAQAVLVKVNDVVVFQDSYEDGTLGDPPAATDPQVGTWDTTDAQSSFTISDADPKYGSQYLHVVTARDHLRSSHFGASTGDTVKFEFAVRPVTEWTLMGLKDIRPEGEFQGGHLGNLVFTGDAPYAWGGVGWTDPGAIFIQNDDGYTYENGMVWTDSGITVGAWNEIVATHIVGSWTLSMSVNGGPTHDFPLLNQGLYNEGTEWEYTAETLDCFELLSTGSYSVGGWDTPAGPLPLKADFNDDGVVDDLDLTVLAMHWQMAGGHSEGDADGDGFIYDLDLTALATEWPTGDLNASPVPEPATLSLLVLASLAALRRRDI